MNRAMITAVIVPICMTAKAGTMRTIVAPEATMNTNLRPILSESLPMSGRQSDMMTSTGIVATARSEERRVGEEGRARRTASSARIQEKAAGATRQALIAAGLS